jgi:hypothetical protein
MAIAWFMTMCATGDSPENVQRPDRTACRNLSIVSNGFSDSQGFVQAVMSIVAKVTAAHGVSMVVGSAAKQP